MTCPNHKKSSTGLHPKSKQTSLSSFPLPKKASSQAAEPTVESPRTPGWHGNKKRWLECHREVFLSALFICFSLLVFHVSLLCFEVFLRMDNGPCRCVGSLRCRWLATSLLVMDSLTTPDGRWWNVRPQQPFLGGQRAYRRPQTVQLSYVSQSWQQASRRRRFEALWKYDTSPEKLWFWRWKSDSDLLGSIAYRYDFDL